MYESQQSTECNVTPDMCVSIKHSKGRNRTVEQEPTLAKLCS